MDGIPPALPSDLEDVAWALETAGSLWKRGERVDAVVWVRRAAQAAGEGDDAKRAATLGRYAAELGDWIGAHTITGEATEGRAPSARGIEAVEALLGDSSSSREGSDVVFLSANDVEIVSAKDFEAGFGATRPSSGAPHRTSSDSDGDVMTVSLHAPDVEVIEDSVPSEEFPEEEPTPVLRPPSSPVPEPGVPSAAQAHAGILNPWGEADRARKENKKLPGAVPPRRFEDEEVVTSASKGGVQGPPKTAGDEDIPRAPKAPRFPPPRERPPAAPAVPNEIETTTYRQVSPRAERERTQEHEASSARSATAVAKPAPKPGPLGRSRPIAPEIPARKPALPAPSPPAMRRPLAPSPPAMRPVAPAAPSSSREKSLPPRLDLLEMIDSVLSEETATKPAPPHPAASTPPPSSTAAEASLRVSVRPTARPPSSTAEGTKPSGPPTRPYGGQTLLDLTAVEALSDLPDDAREAFAQAATMHTIATDEEVSSFALALVVEGEIDVSATIVDAPALRLARNSILRSRGSIVPGVALRLVCASAKALLATWDAPAVEAAFRSCPWVEEDLRSVTDRVQARAGVTMGPLGERFDQSLREHLLSKLTVRSLAAGEVLVEQGKPTPIAIVGIGELVVTKDGRRGETLRPGDFVFPVQILAHAPAPATAAAGAAGAVVLFGDRAVAQELIMGFPPLLELLATL